MNIFRMLAILLVMMNSAFASSDLLLSVGDKSPDYLGKNVAGDKLYVSEHQGQVLVVSFWASWCSPCLKELPILENIQNQLGADKVKVVAVNYKESKKQFRKIRRLFEDLKLTLTHDKKGRIGKAFGVGGIPHLLIVDQEGNIALQSVGYGEGNLDEIANTLNTLLAVY